MARVARFKSILTAGVLFVGTAATAVLTAATSTATTPSPAPGCTAAEPTAIKGALYSYPHGYSVNAQVSVALSDGTHDLNVDGSTRSGGYAISYTYNHYSTDDNKQPALPAYGAASGGTRTWPVTASGVLCVAANVTKASVESYPDTLLANGQRDKTYYGENGEENNPVTPYGTTTIVARLPEATNATSPTGMPFSNDTGYVEGYITCGSGCGSNAGQVIPTGDLTIRAFPHSGGAICGVQGLSAAADVLGPSSNPANGDFYQINALAGQQCGTAYQIYDVTVTCTGFCTPGNPTGSLKLPYRCQDPDNADVTIGGDVARGFEFTTPPPPPPPPPAPPCP